jgi:hypothetical protein
VLQEFFGNALLFQRTGQDAYKKAALGVARAATQTTGLAAGEPSDQFRDERQVPPEPRLPAPDEPTGGGKADRRGVLEPGTEEPTGGTETQLADTTTVTHGDIDPGELTGDKNLRPDLRDEEREHLNPPPKPPPPPVEQPTTAAAPPPLGTPEWEEWLRTTNPEGYAQYLQSQLPKIVSTLPAPQTQFGEWGKPFVHEGKIYSAARNGYLMAYDPASKQEAEQLAARVAAATAARSACSSNTATTDYRSGRRGSG